MTEWRDIATAPKDGTPVLLWATRDGWEETGFCRITGYHDGHGWSVYGAGGPEPSAMQTEREAWKLQRLDSCAPSHWMPLPEAPQ